jgi:hypothetical protein
MVLGFWDQTGRFGHKPADRFGLLTGLNRSTIKPIKPADFGFGSTVFKTLVS